MFKKLKSIFTDDRKFFFTIGVYYYLIGFIEYYQDNKLYYLIYVAIGSIFLVGAIIVSYLNKIDNTLNKINNLKQQEV